MSFDRIKPPEKRLLEREDSRQPDSGQADHAGRAGLFSLSEEPTTPRAGVPRPVPPARLEADGTGRVRTVPTGRSPLHIECGHCGISCPMPLVGAVKRALPLTLVAPWRSHPVFATCPCEERRTWLRPRLGPNG